MREIRLYGSEGGEAKAFPTPIPATLRPAKKPENTGAVNVINAFGQYHFFI